MFAIRYYNIPKIIPLVVIPTWFDDDKISYIIIWKLLWVYDGPWEEMHTISTILHYM